MSTTKALAVLLIASASSGTVLAQTSCAAGQRLNQTQLSNTFTGNTLCAQRGSDKWQEQHRAGAQLWDYKLGTVAMDPTKQVGTWAISGEGANAVLRHTYGGPNYDWAVCGPGGVGTGYTLISTGTAGTISGAQVKSGATSC